MASLRVDVGRSRPACRAGRGAVQDPRLRARGRAGRERPDSTVFGGREDVNTLHLGDAFSSATTLRRPTDACYRTGMNALTIVLTVGSIVSVAPGSQSESESEPARRQRVLTQTGDAARGQAIFSDAQRRCATCHTVDGSGDRCGPDLLGIADKYDRAGLFDEIVEPSKSLLPGYRPTALVLRDGRVVSGILKTRSDDGITLLDGSSEEVEVATRDVTRMTASDVSLMPSDLHARLSAREFASLLTYLETLRRPSLESLAEEALVGDAPRAKVPARLTPLHDASVRFDQPVWASPYPNRNDTLMVLEHRKARAWLLETGDEATRKTLFADLEGDVSDGPWEGLMSVAFHPSFASNRRYFLKHETIEAGQRYTLIVERRAAEDFTRDSGEPSRELLRIPQPADNHNGGTIAFGPDGYLYTAMGDGGPQEDPRGYSQDGRELLGAMLRIDVDRRDPGLPYGIPPTNPWVESPKTARPEVWAIGFREPWRFSFDSETGEIWLGDVGQNRFEEVTVVRVGENHGWNVVEGFATFSEQYARKAAAYVPPVLAYERKLGVSVTGGHVYRGSRAPACRGLYVFGDFESRGIWALRADNRRFESIRELVRSPEKIASFGIDANGEIVVVGYGGTLFRLDLATARFE